MSRVRTESAGDSACPVCHEHSEIFAIGPCDHPICYRCSTRMRVLCSQTYCPICRGELPQIVYLTAKLKYNDVERRSCIPNRKYKILLEDESVEDAFEALLEHCCRVCDTRPKFDSFPALQHHMNRTHTLFACDLCVNHLKIFPFERKFYNRKDLATHRRSGDADNRSYRGHPLCRFCDIRYMDNDELLRHLRKSHYYCHFCDANASNNEYFDDYPDLKEHFQKHHFLCEEGECGFRETRFTNAFASDIDLKAHIAAEHMGNKSKAQSRELRTIDVSFQMAPRRRGRDAGVVAPDDFEEVNESNRGPRDRRNRRYNNRYESSGTENVVPPPEASAPPPPPEPPALDDFPTLGNVQPPFIPTALKPSEPVEDFPSLPTTTVPSRVGAVTSSSSLASASMNAGKSSAAAASQKPRGSSSAVSSAVMSSGASRPGSVRSLVETKRPMQTGTVTKQSWAAPRLASGEDFPSLGGDKKSAAAKDGLNLVNLGVWIKNEKKSKSKVGGGGGSASGNSASLASLGRSLCDDGEFPSLAGGSTTKEATWVQKNAKSVKNKIEKPAPLGSVLGLSSQKKSKNEVTLLNGSIDSKAEESKSKKKKKKQKEKEQEKKAGTEDSGISLSSIASELDAASMISEQNTATQEDSSGSLSNQENSVSHDHKNSVEIPSYEQKAPIASESVDDELSENGKWETVVGKRSVGFHEDDFPSLSTLSKKVQEDDFPSRSVLSKKVQENDLPSRSALSKKVQEDDFPSLSALSKKVQEDDFPSLSALSKKNGGKSYLGTATSAEKTAPKKSHSLVTTKTSKTFQDDFPSLSATSDKKTLSTAQETASEKGGIKRNEVPKPAKSLPSEDFPVLQAQTKKSRPPPGFGKAQVAAPPPGLGGKPPSTGRAPPGLNSASTVSSSSSSQASIPMAVKLNLYSYAPPLNGKERNISLVSRIRQLLILKDGAFDKFRTLAAEFRSGQMNSQEYYKACQDLMGQERFVEVLPELVALLPDILKQHELMEAYSQSILGMCAPLSLMSCPTCHQYLQLEDSPAHFTTHVNLGQDMTAAAAALPLKT